MTISTYSELKSEIIRWADRSDTAFADAVPGFISLAEAEKNRVLVEERMEVSASLVVENGAATLPADCLSVITATFDDCVLTAISDYQAAEKRYAGQPKHIVVSAASIKVIPAGDDSFSINIIYRQKVPALSDLNTSNWVLQNHPDVYLYGALAHAEFFLVNDERMARFKTLAVSAIQQLIDSNISRIAQPARVGSVFCGGI